MRIPVIRGLIERRILANYRIDAEVARRVIPPPFRPKLVHGFAIGGVCLIRLRRVRPALLPIPVGISSENGAHRFAVEWDTPSGAQTGVYIPRRDTSSFLNAAIGGRLFPGVHHRAEFRVVESAEGLTVAFQSEDGSTCVEVDARVARELPSGSVFRSLAEASGFFEVGSLGHSATANPKVFDGLELRTGYWAVEPLDVVSVKSSFFDDPRRFPVGSIEFDCALLMRDVPHEWYGRGELRESA